MATDGGDTPSPAWVLSRFTSFGPLEGDEIAALASMAGPARPVAKGGVICSAGEARRSLCLLTEGWAVSAVSLSEGERQIVGVHLPGDLLGLAGLGTSEPFDEALAVTASTIRSVPLASLRTLFADQPRLAAMLFVISQEERALAMERQALMGHARAKARLAAQFVRLSERLAQLDPAWRTRFDLPLTQQDLADLIGVSTVHLNGIVQELRAQKVIRLTRRELHILNYDALLALAGIAEWKQARPGWLPLAAGADGAG